MAKVQGGLFGDIGFSHDTGPNCCGQLQLYSFVEKPIQRYEGFANPKLVVFPAWQTREEQFADFSRKFAEVLEEDSSDHFSDEEEEDPGCCYAFATLTLIKSPEPQIPGFIEYLERIGWKTDQQGRNPKTGNIIVHMSKSL